MLKSTKAVIFDLDGLLIDSEATYQKAWQQALAQMGYEFDEEFYQQLLGSDARNVEKKLHQSLPSDFDLMVFRQLSAECWHTQVNQTGIPVMPGVEAVLYQLQRLGWLTAVATNSHQAQAHKLLQFAGLEHGFTHVFASDQVANPKPAPDIYKFAADSLSLSPVDCLVLEDSHIGVKAAVAAGMPCCWIPGFSTPSKVSEFTNCLVLDSLDQLAARLQQLSV